MNLDHQAIVEQLNKLLAYELTSIDQYTAHSRIYEDMGLENSMNASTTKWMTNVDTPIY